MAETPVTPSESQKTSTGLEQNTAALLCYLFTWVTGLIFFIVEKDNKYVRFHAMQSILFGAAVAVGAILLFVVVMVLNQIPILGGVLALLLDIAFYVGVLVVWILLMVKAYQGERYKLPFLGDTAERNA